ncbi:response regulator [Salinimonas chungwhensis]|uniref:response regulator n=1 Tax=Salinimonas chungwhensis TaxID=265425 RepID=UPI00037A364F|nr:response regulator [Salinimonas chungwhensis]
MDKFPPITPMADLRFLIIDNQNLVHDQITQALREIGIKRVSCAVNAYHALRECERQHFDFILIAFNISHDKDGFHLLEELKHHHHVTQKTTVIFLSAETSAELVNCIVELQPDDFWVKPLDRKRIETRLRYLITVRNKLHKLLHCLYQQDYSAAIYYAQRHLTDPGMAEFHPRLRRAVGECLIALREFSQAEDYYRKLLDNSDHAWIHVGLARSVLRQNNLEKAEGIVEDLLERDDTRFQTLDLLAQYYLEKEDYTQAYEKIKLASQLAPRNIERNKKLWDLARLTRDRHGQLKAVQNMARFAKNSIHDSPELSLNVVRATLDLATSMTQHDVDQLLKRASHDLQQLERRKGAGIELREQLDIIKARMLCLSDNKQQAEAIMKDKKPELTGTSMEDNLDKMKAFHELGMKEHCLAILDKLRQQIEGDTFSSYVVDEYLKQEEIERREINFTTKELKEMAAVNYKENRMQPAYNNLRQALQLSPDNRQIALSLLKVLTQLIKKDVLSQEQIAVLQQAAKTLNSHSLSEDQQKKCDEYFAILQVASENISLSSEAQ